MQKVAVLFHLTGIGHFREAHAIAQQMSKMGFQVQMINPSARLRSSGNKFAKLLLVLRHIPYSFIYFFMRNFPNVGNGNKRKNNVVVVVTRLMFSSAYKLMKLLGMYFSDSLVLGDYDYVISIHPVATAFACGARKKAGCVLINVCPDEVEAMGASFYWIDGVITTVNSENTKNSFIAIGAKEELLLIIGHPLDVKILSDREKIFKRVQDSLALERLNIGLYIGGFAPKKQKEAIFQVIKELSEPIRSGKLLVTVITGGHKDFEKNIEKILSENSLKDRVKIIHTASPKELVDEGHALIHNDINIMFSRPSELVFYSLATGIPHIMFPPVGPQEIDMLRLLRKNAKVEEYLQLKGSLYNYLSDKGKLLSLSRNLYNSNYCFDCAINLGRLLV